MRSLAFVRLHLGSVVNDPGGIGGQCVDLVNLYLHEVRGIASVRANAADWAEVAVPGFVWVRNGPTNSPPLGSIVVWGIYPPLGISRFGHVAIALVSDVMEMVSCDQNWPDGAPTSLVLHSYAGVLGWHQPK